MERVETEIVNKWIVHFLEGSASREELLCLKHWIEESEENKKSYQHIKNIWEMSDSGNKDVMVSTEEAFDHVLDKIIEVPRLNKSWIKYFRKVAAILFIPMVLGSFFVGRYSKNEISIPSVSFNEIYSSFGTRSTVVLSDGSKVWLNSGSKLRYPDKFVSARREVFLTGEAFFEVHSDVSKPFVVKTNSLTVQATGTKFNIQAFRSESSVQVSLVSGKISVNKNTSVGDEPALANLIPNQMLSYDTLTGRSQTYTGDVYEFIAWKDGRLVFRNRPLSEVVKKLSQLYNVEIELRGKELQDYRYRATFEEESLNEILKLIKLSSPIQFWETTRSFQPDGSFTRRKIIITSL